MTQFTYYGSRIASPQPEPYRGVMEAAGAYLELRIDVREPIELSHFVRMFASLGEQYERYMLQIGRIDTSTAKIYIKRIREGSIIAELVPVVYPIIADMDAVLIVREFGRMIRSRLIPYFEPGGRAEGANKTEIRDLMNGVVAIANDPDGKATLTSVSLREKSRDGEERELIMQFDSRQAKQAVKELEAHYEQLSQPASEKHENVLMTFFQSNKKIPDGEQRSGEQVIVESIDRKPRPVIYVSDLAKHRIKSAVIHGDDNIYKKGFYVDVEVDRYRGKVAAYKVIVIREIIDLPDGEN